FLPTQVVVNGQVQGKGLILGIRFITGFPVEGQVFLIRGKVEVAEARHLGGEIGFVVDLPQRGRDRHRAVSRGSGILAVQVGNGSGYGAGTVIARDVLARGAAERAVCSSGLRHNISVRGCVVAV